MLRRKKQKVRICNGGVMEEDRLGMTITGDVAELLKDDKGLIGVTIGGGAPYCPCLYVVQIFDCSPAAQDARLKVGDEIFSVNGTIVKGEQKAVVAGMIQNSEGPVKIGFNVLHADPKQGLTLDITLKKMKHRVVESMNSETADALGLSRAILCNDLLVRKLKVLEQSSKEYKKFIEYLDSLLNSQYRVARVQREIGDLFCEVAARENSSSANNAFNAFGEAHRSIEKTSIKLVQHLHPILKDLSTFIQKAIPDTKLTLKKYLDAKFEYLSFCLKLKEMDDEEIQFASLEESLYRVETGNYEYRLMLRCRQESKERFLRLRSDVMVKLELLDQKHVQDITVQLSNFVKAMMNAHLQCRSIVEHLNGLFPIEIDLTQVAYKYNTSGRLSEDDSNVSINDSQNEDIFCGEEKTVQTTNLVDWS